jgi:hypothetical protein
MWSRWIMDATVHLDNGGTHRVRWLGERSRDDGQGWQLQAEFWLAAPITFPRSLAFCPFF